MNYYVYILTNTHNTVLYIGVTNNIHRRIEEHIDKVVESFTKRYNLNKLVYYETTQNINEAIEREKTLKCWSREKKNKLIESKNPNWKNLIEDLLN